jgi:hypothetical protein
MLSEKKPHGMPSTARAHIDELLDEALNETFPASDSVAINIERNPDDRKIVTFLWNLRSTRWCGQRGP